MKWLVTNVTILLLVSLLIVGCGGGGSNFSTPTEKEKPVGNNNNTANSIDFISATPQTIALKGTGGPPRSETSVLVFKVVDEYGDPVPNQIVNFRLSTEIGGLFLSNSKAVSDSAGLVQVTVNSGNMPTHIRVHATLDRNPSIMVVSNELAVTTGLPDQNSITLCAETSDFEICKGHIPISAFCDDVKIKFYAADHFNNFVPDGSVVYFTTEGGSIIGSSTITDGVCEVVWHFVNPIPKDGQIRILAFSIGEESFKDVNGNGFFDPEDDFDPNTDMAEPFRDDNENGQYDYKEEYWDYNHNGKFDGEPNGIYNGVLCSDEAEALGLCSKELVYVQDSIYLVIDDISFGEPGSIDFISATPQTIALKGTGGPPRTETSVLVFKVVDKFGDPVPNQTVDFHLSTEIGGLSLSNSNDVSDFEGLVKVTVNSGNMATHVRVHASLDSNPLIRVVSDELVVSTGLPDQNSVTLFSKFVEIEYDEWAYGKAELDIVFQAADHFNNCVPDGTVVYFTTEGGSIESSAKTERGGCKVRWRSGNPVPEDDTITILAVCIGEESFTDVNGNGHFDAEDWFDHSSDMAEPFRDDNENDQYDYGEEYWDYNGNGEFDGVPNGIYNGSLCSDEAEALGLCTKELVYVQKSLQLMKIDVQKEWSSGNVSSIDFISATPEALALKGTGGPARSETSVLIFMVVDENGNPVQKQNINFKLSTEIGGLSLSSPSAISDADGLVRVTVNAGNMPTHVRVHAYLASNPLITVVSDELAVSTGLPDQNSISLGPREYKISLEEYEDGFLEIPIIFLAADHFNNFVPDGTVVYFTTEGGSIPASAVIEDGKCIYKNKKYVPWYCGNPIPNDGRITILAFCIGEESFNDKNGNGFFDPNDQFDLSTDLAEPFRDDNENGVYDYGEEYWDFNADGDFDGVPNEIYNGSLCSDEAEALGLCTKELVYVQKSIHFIIDTGSLEKASGIDFVSATPQTIALKGTGGPARSETSVVVFKAVDEYGSPVLNQAVNFTLSTEIGGLSLSSSSAISNTEGLVQVTVKAGNIPTHVRVRATLADNPSITIVSDELAVGTGLPDQNSISISAETLNPEAWNYNNVEVPIIFQAADLFNNFVPDGTVVYFTTEGGSIIASSTIKEGVCEVQWRSGNPKPVNGRFTILAFCIGEESFTDVNGNGIFDELDWFDNDTDLAEPFRDDNENGVYDFGEEYWDYDDNGNFDGVPNGIYNGTLCSDEAEELGLCTKELVYVQEDITLVMSSSFAVITFDPASVNLIGKNSQTVTVTIVDINNNPMPCSTEITVKTTNGVFADDSQSKDFKVPNTNQGGPGATEFSVTLLPSEDGKTFGILQVEVTTPFEHVSAKSITVVDEN
ncbi:MAG: hypothetical protein ACMUIU_01135 [bacterium]